MWLRGVVRVLIKYVVCVVPTILYEFLGAHVDVFVVCMLTCSLLTV